MRRDRRCIVVAAPVQLCGGASKAGKNGRAAILSNRPGGVERAFASTISKLAMRELLKPGGDNGIA
jgi:hypothetical protein